MRRIVSYVVILVALWVGVQSAQGASGTYYPTIHPPQLVKTGGKQGYVVGSVTHHLRGKITIKGTVYLTVNEATVQKYDILYTSGARTKRDVTRSITKNVILRKRSQGVRYWKVEIVYWDVRFPAKKIYFEQPVGTPLLA